MKVKEFLIKLVVTAMLVVALAIPAFAESDYEKIGVWDSADIYLDKNSIVYYDDFIIISGKVVAPEGSYREFHSYPYTLATEYYFEYALNKKAHSYKLLKEFAEAQGYVKKENNVNVNVTMQEWLEENWEYSEKDFHKQFDFNVEHDINEIPWTNFGSNDGLLTIVYDNAMRMANIKNDTDLKDSATEQGNRGTASAPSSSTNLLLVILAAAVGILGTVVFMQYKNKK